MENLTLQYILNRRSVRKYQPQKVPKDIITDLLKAAMNAPTACNQQCWHFVVIENKEILKDLSSIHGGYHTLKNSPLAILVCGEPGTAILECFWEQDCAAASENILIAAQSFDLGAVWLGVNPTAKEESGMITKFLHLPEHIKPFSIISLGYPAGPVDTQCKYDEGKIHYDGKW